MAIDLDKYQYEQIKFNFIESMMDRIIKFLINKMVKIIKYSKKFNIKLLKENVKLVS